MRIALDQIECIECDLNLHGPTFYHIPRTGLEGKFSIAYCVSVALQQGRVGLEEFADEKISDPQVQEFMKKVKDVRNQGKEEVLTIRLKDGRGFSHSVDKAKGDALGNPLSDEEVQEKFEACAKSVLTPKNIQKAVQEISKLEKVRNFREFMNEILGELKPSS
jgi:2-methylcitrate dehydratase PrpD